MHFFIAGVMQGARTDKYIEAQDYRLALTRTIKKNFPEARITDPWALNPGSVDFEETRARETFHTMTALAGEADLLIAYLPTVSMGTAMEMWEAHKSGTYIIAVTPHLYHWAIRFTADEIYPDLDTVLQLLENGHVAQILSDNSAVDGPQRAD